MKKWILGLGVSLILSGCVAAVVAGAAGLVVYDRRGVITMEKDARIFHQINTEIAKDPRFTNSHIVVSSFNKTVLLAGQTPFSSLKMAAEKIAQTTPDVARVYNEIAIGSPSSFDTRARDAWITSQVRAKMLAKKDLESGSFRILTEDGVVYLLGIVSKGQAKLATEVASSVKGVKKVVKVFQYY